LSPSSIAGDATANAELGHEPNADWVTIEAAYKRLIKEHHPDRDGFTPRNSLGRAAKGAGECELRLPSRPSQRPELR